MKNNLVKIAFTFIMLFGVVQAENKCGPVMGGAVINFSFECLNDSSAIVVDPDIKYSGWKYSFDSLNDGVFGESLNTFFEITGMAFNETATDAYLVISADVPLGGLMTNKAHDGKIQYGDIFINLSGKNFFTALNDGDLFAIRFTSNNESGASNVGIYGAVAASAVGALNAGYATLNDYNNKVISLGGTPVYGELGSLQTYYAGNIGYNIISSGDYLGAISTPTNEELKALGYDFSKFASGGYSFAIKFNKTLIIDECGVIGGDGKSCLDCKGDLCGNVVVDDCGVCGGDGSSCIEITCVEETATTAEKRKSKKVKQAAKVLYDRVVYFADRSSGCDGKGRDDIIREAKSLYQKIVKILNEEVLNTVMTCSDSVCSQVSTRNIKKRLKKIGYKLYLVQLDTKRDTIRVCHIKHDPHSGGITSIDFYYDLEDAINDLPKEQYSCS